MQKVETLSAAAMLFVMLAWAFPCKASGRVPPRKLIPQKLSQGLQTACLKYYTGEEDGGLAHITYWTLTTDSPAYQALDPPEQAKVDKIQMNRLHSALFQPDQIIPGYEATGLLRRGRRRQNITLKLPDDWNGNLVVCGTPAFRNEYASEAVLTPWLLAQGYAVIGGDKGVPNGLTDLLTGNHPSRYWGIMMLDMALFARRNIANATNRNVRRIYAVGLSNGGYQVRRALELDHRRHRYPWRRRLIFDGGIDWSGTYFAGVGMLDQDGDGRVSVEEYAQANTLVSTSDQAVLAMGWAHGPDTLTTPEAFALDPPFAPVHGDMTAAGYTPESAVIWGYYNTNFDAYGGVWRGVGYYNLLSYAYRAELLGDTAETAAAYSCFSDPQYPDALPPLYNYLDQAENGGWTPSGVYWALKNANTGRFSVPMLTLHGLSDGLLGFDAHAAPYRQTVEKYGSPALHRLYAVENAGHVDAHADGWADFNFDGKSGNEGVADRLTPLQAYVQRAFTYLVDWVENRIPAPDSTIITTDPVNDVADPEELSW